ncbi:hypothetical protein TNCV_4189741 [Trichonephila clavipes]|nr:hypothetical protein TNCV_4189741 [Trichonephila clavipes]
MLLLRDLFCLHRNAHTTTDTTADNAPGSGKKDPKSEGGQVDQSETWTIIQLFHGYDKSHVIKLSGQNNSAGTTTDEVCRPVGRSPFFLRSDWPRPFACRKVGVEMDWVDPKINDPRQGDLE